MSTSPDKMTPLVAVARLAQSRAPLGKPGSREGGGTVLAMLVALASHARLVEGRWLCWPALQTLADDARVSRRTAGSVLAQIGIVIGKPDTAPPDKLRIVRIVHQRNAEGRQGCSVFELDLVAIMDLAAAHPRVRELPSGDLLSVQELPPGGAPECNERHSRRQLATVQSAPAAHKQIQEQDQEQIPPGGTPAAPPSGEVLKLELVEPKPARVQPQPQPQKAGKAAAARPALPAVRGRPKRPTTPEEGEVLGAFRVAYRDKNGHQPVVPSREPATKLLKAVNGNVEDAIRRVRRAVAENVTDLHVVANNPNRYGAAMSSPPARKGDVRLLAQEGESPNIQVGYQ